MSFPLDSKRTSSQGSGLHCWQGRGEIPDTLVAQSPRAGVSVKPWWSWAPAGEERGRSFPELWDCQAAVQDLQHEGHKPVEAPCLSSASLRDPGPGACSPVLLSHHHRSEEESGVQRGKENCPRHTVEFCVILGPVILLGPESLLTAPESCAFGGKFLSCIVSFFPPETTGSWGVRSKVLAWVGCG